MPKYWLAWCAGRGSQMNSRSCQRGILELCAGRRARRDRKNEVRITSKARPLARDWTRARGTFGSSMKPKRSVTRAKDAIRELFDRAVALAKRRGATQSFEVAVGPGLPFAPADPMLFDQVLANLIGNATRYAGPTTRIVLRASAGPDAIVLSVADDGPGIAPEMLPHVFEKFVRAPRRGGDAGEGSGLGLAIVKGIVDAHHGSIAAI